MEKICMVGTGYVGLVSGACFAHLGHKVICVDNNTTRIENLDKGIMPIYEKNLKEICLLSQQFVKNPDQTVEVYLSSNKCAVLNFVRLEVGEGIEKEETDFAAEVAAQSAAFNK